MNEIIYTWQAVLLDNGHIAIHRLNMRTGITTSGVSDPEVESEIKDLLEREGGSE